jgi:cell division protein FtsQ
LLRILKISSLFITALGLLTLCGFIVKKNHVNNLKSIDINIYRGAEKGFLNKQELLSIIIDNGDSVTNMLVKDINHNVIENKLQNIPYVKETDSYLTLNGKLLVNIKEKNPAIRIFNDKGNSFYLDNYGDIIPISKNYTPRVTIANGYIKEKIPETTGNIFDTIYNSSQYRKLFILMKKINKYELLSSQINQIYINSKGNYDLIPELGDHIIKFGDFEDIKMKLDNLEAFYRKILLTSDWNKYSIINLTYKDQIVCTKK